MLREFDQDFLISVTQGEKLDAWKVVEAFVDCLAVAFIFLDHSFD